MSGSSGRTRTKATTDPDAPEQDVETSPEVGGEVVAQGPVAGPGVNAATAAADEQEQPTEPDHGGASGSSGTPYLNVSGGPVTYTEHGHTVADGEWTPGVTLDRIGRHQRDRGFLRSRTSLGMT